MTEPTLSALAFAQPLWAPDEDQSTAAATAPRDSGHTTPRGNGAVHEADLARGEEQLSRVLGW